MILWADGRTRDAIELAPPPSRLLIIPCLKFHARWNANSAKPKYVTSRNVDNRESSFKREQLNRRNFARSTKSFHHVTVGFPLEINPLADQVSLIFANQICLLQLPVVANYNFIARNACNNKIKLKT